MHLVLSRDYNTLCTTMPVDDAVYLWNNSVVVILLQVIICSSYSVTLPSMYQFVTTPDTPPEKAEVGVIITTWQLQL